MRYRYAVPLFAAVFLIQTSIMNTIAIFGITPNLLLCLEIVVCYMYERKTNGLILGTVFGLLYDLCFSPYIGVSALLMFAAGLVCIFLSETLNKENIATVLLITSGISFSYNLLYWLMMLVLGCACSFVFFIKLQLICVCLNAAAITVMYAPAIRRVVKFRQDRHFIND